MLFLLSSMALVFAACADDSSADTTTLQAAVSTIGQTTTTETPDTTTSILSSTTTLVVWADTAVAEGLIHAVFDEDDTAIEAAASVSNRAKADATEFRDFSRAVNGVLVEATCEIADPRLVSCVVVGSDDISIAVGGDPYTKQWDFDFNSEWITDFGREETDEIEAFFNWAFNTYPNICDTPPQCALALLDIVDEYLLTPAGTIGAHVAAYNAADIDGVMALFTEESVITGHPFDASSTGLAEIRALHVTDMAAAASENAYTISNVEVSGNTVTWDHLWVNDVGEEYCQFGQSAVVEEGIILTWTWPSDGGDCP
jgi:hypothetical protein